MRGEREADGLFLMLLWALLLGILIFLNTNCAPPGAAGGVSTVERNVCFTRPEITRIRVGIAKRKQKLRDCKTNCEARIKQIKLEYEARVIKWQREALASAKNYNKCANKPKPNTFFRDLGIGLGLAGAAIAGGLLGYGLGKVTK
jgi:hypothetical protein